MKNKSIARLIVYAGLIGILAFILIPESGSTHRPDWQVVAKTKLRSLNVLYATYTASGARIRPLHSLEELKEMARRDGTGLSIFSTYDPLNRKKTPVVYFKPQSHDQDELIFVFRDPILRYEKPSYNDEDLKELRYIACYTKSGFAALKSKPPELNQSEQVDADNPDNPPENSKNELDD